MRALWTGTAVLLQMSRSALSPASCDISVGACMRASQLSPELDNREEHAEVVNKNKFIL